MLCKLFCMKTKLLLFIVNYFLVVLVWPTCMRPVSQNAFDAPDTACISIVVILSSCSKQKYLLSYSWPAGSWWTLSWPWFLVWRTPASWTPLHLKHSERGVSGDMRSLWISTGRLGVGEVGGWLTSEDLMKSVCVLTNTSVTLWRPQTWSCSFKADLQGQRWCNAGRVSAASLRESFTPQPV